MEYQYTSNNDLSEAKPSHSAASRYRYDGNNRSLLTVRGGLRTDPPYLPRELILYSCVFSNYFGCNW